MEVKKDILWRVYLSYILMVIVCLVIFSKAVYIQQVQGQHWRSMSDSLHQKIEEVEAERGTIYSEDGKMLSTSIPQFDIYIDFAADGLREKSGVRFRNNVDSLSHCLANLFKDRSESEYHKMLQHGFKVKDRYFLLQKNISYRQYQDLKQFPLVRLGRNKSGFIVSNRTIRLNPYKIFAYRTIGLDRENAQKIGLEQTYDTILKGTSGKHLVRYIAGGVSVPVEGGDDLQIEPENGKDIVTTLDVFIQEVAENALQKMMIQNDAEHGCAIVMETKTGKVKAIANLGKLLDKDGKEYGFGENFNYAISASEPGSTFKLATMLSLLEDKKINLASTVNLNGGVWEINGQTVYDSEKHGRMLVTAKQAFELSSNVGMAKMAYYSYWKKPSQFLGHLHNMRLDTLTGIDITGERPSVIHKPGSRFWSANTLPWMAFGYNLEVTPLQTLTLYNAIANNGKMMRPYLLNAVKDEGEVIDDRQPHVLIDKICSDSTLLQLKECLEGVCIEGTGKELFKNSVYKVAGKTGTALVANGNKGYDDMIYQSSFAGYFPADNPQYTCIVVIRNKPHAPVFYGAAVAGPVFKEIADRLYTTYVRQVNYAATPIKTDSSFFSYVGSKQDIKQVLNAIKLPNKDNDNSIDGIVSLSGTSTAATLSERSVSNNYMPLLKGMGLKDVVVLCEGMGLKVNVKGKGKVASQSIYPGQSVAHGQVVTVELN
ncbi:penicillin-binding protein [Parasediminibacterium sp. JCM 36343]|uniref:penicillin-binding protein n=1 Tax=Parasediminibacterium sp. JCM 36343 TaxID=3374279 RepID=UPI00397D8810